MTCIVPTFAPVDSSFSLTRVTRLITRVDMKRLSRKWNPACCCWKLKTLEQMLPTFLRGVRRPLRFRRKRQAGTARATLQPGFLIVGKRDLHNRIARQMYLSSIYHRQSHGVHSLSMRQLPQPAVHAYSLHHAYEHHKSNNAGVFDPRNSQDVNEKWCSRYLPCERRLTDVALN